MPVGIAFSDFIFNVLSLCCVVFCFFIIIDFSFCSFICSFLKFVVQTKKPLLVFLSQRTNIFHRQQYFEPKSKLFSNFFAIAYTKHKIVVSSSFNKRFFLFFLFCLFVDVVNVFFCFFLTTLLFFVHAMHCRYFTKDSRAVCAGFCDTLSRSVLEFLVDLQLRHEDYFSDVNDCDRLFDAFQVQPHVRQGARHVSSAISHRTVFGVGIDLSLRHINL